MKNHDRPVTLRASVWQRCGAHRESIDWEWSPMTKRKVGFYELEHGAHHSWLVGKWGWDRTWSVLRQSWGHTGDSPELEGIFAWTSKSTVAVIQDGWGMGWHRGQTRAETTSGRFP